MLGTAASSTTCMAGPFLLPDAAPNQDVKDFLGWLSGLTRYRGAGAPLTNQDRQEHISRLVPFQPRVPLNEELQAQQDAREEARAAKAERQQLAEQDEVARNLWMEQHTVGPGGNYPGALDAEATEYKLKLQQWNDQEDAIGDASLHGTPLDVTL